MTKKQEYINHMKGYMNTLEIQSKNSSDKTRAMTLAFQIIGVKESIRIAEAML